MVKWKCGMSGVLAHLTSHIYPFHITKEIPSEHLREGWVLMLKLAEYQRKSTTSPGVFAGEDKQ